MFADLNLARRLERAEARANAGFVEARAAVQPGSGAEWIQVAGAYAMFDGVESPCTQTFCLGMHQETTEEHIFRIEEFFRGHGAPVFHEVSPLADPSVPHLLSREYEPFEFTSVMFLPLAGGREPGASQSENLHVRTMRPGEAGLWAATSAKGWSESIELAGFLEDMARILAARPEGLAFFAELDGKPVATASLNISDGVALFAGASTIPKLGTGARRTLCSKRVCGTAMKPAATSP